jgi:hypothetical protein
VAYLQQRGFLDASTLVVHGVQCTADDIARLRHSGATVVTCPRSNAYVGAGEPPLADFYAAGVPVAFGTDSLASVEDLNVFSELAEARRLAPAVPARPPDRERDAGRGARPGIRARLREPGTGEARGAAQRRRAGRRDRCGRIPAVRPHHRDEVRDAVPAAAGMTRLATYLSFVRSATRCSRCRSR